MSRQHKVDAHRVQPESIDLWPHELLVESLYTPTVVHSGGEQYSIAAAAVGSLVLGGTPLVRIFCGKHCRSVVGRLDVIGGVWWRSDGQPERVPPVAAVVRLRTPDSPQRGTPMVEWCRMLVNHLDDPDIIARMHALRTPPLPAVVIGECPIHGVRPFKVDEARARAANAWNRLRPIFDSHGHPTQDDTPIKPGRWNL